MAGAWYRNSLGGVLGWVVVFGIIIGFPLCLGFLAGFDLLAMLVGVAGLVAMHVALTLTPLWRQHICGTPRGERALRWTFGLAVAVTLVLPVSFAFHVTLLLIIAGALGPGNSILQNLGFVNTLYLTLLHGGTVYASMAILFGLLYLLLPPRPNDAVEPLSTHCENCGYDLRGSLEAARCPECGAAFKPDRVRAAVRAERP